MAKVTECRACGSKALTTVFSLHSSEKRWFKKSGNEKSDFVLCDPSRDARACGLLQSARQVQPVSIMPSSRMRTNRENLEAIATESLELLSGRDCLALDIGCNDGTLLSFYPRWVERHGIDQSDDIDTIGNWASTTKAMFPSPDSDRAFEGQKFDIITAVSVLENIDNPRAFIENVKAHLADDGVFALETLYAPIVLTRNAIDLLHPGISAVYSLSVLEWIIRDAGLKVFKGLSLIHI